MTIDFSHDIRLRVRYGETDQMGYCYYGNYAQYFEVGRVECLRTLGCSYKQLEADGIMLPVKDYSIQYKSPALYDDELTIKTKIVLVAGARIQFDYTILNDADKLVAEATTTLVFVSKNNMRPCQPPQHFIDLIQPFAQ